LTSKGLAELLKHLSIIFNSAIGSFDETIKDNIISVPSGEINESSDATKTFG